MKSFQVLFFVLIGCGTSSGDLDLSKRDPRCVAACPETMPEYEGVGAVCDTASRAQCLDECEARIAGLPSVCQSCLLENACFDPGGCVGIGGGEDCNGTTCTMSSQFGSCTYTAGDMAGRLACLQKVDPRRTVACQASFQSTTKCATVCT